MAITQVSDVIVPSVFDQYVQLFTAEKHELIDSGVVSVDADISNKLAGGGTTFNSPSWKDLDNTASVRATDATTDVLTPLKTSAVEEIQVRISRAQGWQSADLTGLLAGADPMRSIASRVGEYWRRADQRSFVAMMTGVFADNDASNTGDYTSDISAGGTYTPGVTSFSAEAAIDAMLTAGDNMGDFVAIMVHSAVYGRMIKNDLIDFIQDSRNPSGQGIATFFGRRVIVDDNMPFSGSVFHTWFFGVGAIRFGSTPAPNPVAIQREELQGNGFGTETLIHRRVYCFHPVGHKFTGTATLGGPTDATTSGNLGNADAWARVFPERKQIKIARLITTEA